VSSRTRRLLFAIVASVVVAVCLVPAASADPLTEPRDVGNYYLAPHVGFFGPPRSDAGMSVDGAGDVNGDGHDDVIIGAPGDGAAGLYSGGAYVVFGPLNDRPIDREEDRSIDLSTLGAGGFRIEGASGYLPDLDIDASRAGRSVSAAGDVNLDGFDDVIVGAPGWAANPPDPPGSAFVVFGKPTTETVDLAHLGSHGFEIVGPAVGPRSNGYWVDGAGDVNGDGRGDVVVAARFNGSGFVVFGKGGTDTVRLDALGTGGFEVRNVPATEYLHFVGAGDVNADGRGDLAASNTRLNYVVFGKESTSPVDLAALGAGGFTITGAGSSAWPGPNVAAGGDVNGDGYDDVLIGDEDTTFNGSSAGSVWVVFGKASATTVDVNAAGKWFRIDGMARDKAGTALASAGDLNADGRDDVLLRGTGRAYLVLGKASTTKVSLGQLGGRGFSISSGSPYGGTIARAGDLIGNARADILLGDGARLIEAPAILDLSTTTGPPTTVLYLAGSFFDPGEPVDVFLDGVLQRRLTADAGGNFANQRVAVPASALPGMHTFRAIGATSGRSVERLFLVRTSWTHAGFAATRTAYNANENVLGRSTVAGLQPAWTASPAGPFAGSPIVAAGNVHLASRAGVVTTLDHATGALLWSTPIGAAIAGGPAAANSTVYVGGADGRLHALDKRFGRPRWVKQLSGAIDSSAAVSQSIVYAHTRDGYVFALDANNGSEKWRTFVGDGAGASPAVASGRVFIVGGSSLAALSTTNGALLWTAPLGASGAATPVVSSGVVYVGTTGDAHTMALTATSGARRWSRALAETLPGDVTTLAVGEGVVYAQTTNGLHALNAADGLQRWQRAGGAAAGETLALANHVLYLPGPVALNAATGATLWTGASGDGSPAVADGTLYAGARAFRLP
jgi:outer membrane protein assembly factor BamB